MFQAIKHKTKSEWTIKNSKYSFKEDWILQAYKLGHKKYLDWVAFLDSEFNDKVSLIREYYICPEEKIFSEPAGVKVIFSDLKEAQKYCKILNEV